MMQDGYDARRTEPGGLEAATRSGERARRRATLRRSLSLTFLSTLLPGLGLVWTKRRRLGVLLAAFTLLTLLALAVVLVGGGMLNGAATVLTSKGLRIALAVALAGLVLWLVSIVVTARTTHERSWTRRGETVFKAFTALMCLAVTLPAAEAVRYVAVTQDAFGSMFITNDKGSAPKENAFRKKDRVNFLLIGSDAGADRVGLRTDSMMVASVDTHTGDTTLISIPRNWNHVPFPASNPLHDIYPDGFTCKPGRTTSNPCWMDAVWAEADTEHPELFKGQQYAGLNTTRDVISEITGLPIDYSTVINLQGFRDLVDAMGGVDLTIPQGGIAIGGKIVNGVQTGITGRIPEGKQHLNGQLALWYARSRVETGDGDRMRRQRCMVNALVNQSNPVSLVQRFPDIMKVAKENILVDLPQDQLPDLAGLAETMKKGQMKSVNLAYPVISDANPDFAKVRELVQKGLERPKPTAKPAPKTTSSSSSTTQSSSSSSTTEAVSDTTATC